MISFTGISDSGYSYTDARSAVISPGATAMLVLLRYRHIANATNNRSRPTNIVT
jgi:hypothetical protein